MNSEYIEPIASTSSQTAVNQATTSTTTTPETLILPLLHTADQYENFDEIEMKPTLATTPATELKNVPNNGSVSSNITSIGKFGTLHCS